MPRTPEQFAEAFTKSYTIIQRDYATPCWETKRSLTPEGYGRMFYKGRLVGTHRVSWLLYRGLIPDGLDVLHRCDNPRCCNPEHLFVGTPRDNTLDSIAKGRAHRAIMENAPTTKLSRHEVIEIRKIYAKDKPTKKALAQRFNCSETNVAAILRRQTWRYI